jgi:hypothetical protein
MAWAELHHCESLQGLWVALDNCRYDQTTRQPIEGDIVDSDEDLGDLCSRLRELGRSSCVICYCDREPTVESRAEHPESVVARVSLGR